MDEFSTRVKTIIRFSLYAMSLSLFGFAILPVYRGYLLGFFIGGAASIINAIYLMRKIRLLGDLITGGTRRSIGLGFLTRAAVALLAVMVAFQTESIELFGTIVGLFLVQLVTLLLGLISKSNPK